MSGGSGPYSRSVAPWRAPASARRTPVPTSEVVAARPQREALHAALAGQPPPCAASPAIWTSGDETDVLVAQQGCTECPARRECGAYADAIQASAGVWAGLDRTARDGCRRPITDERKSA